MKTSSYDEPYDEESEEIDAIAEYHSSEIEAPVDSEVQTDYETPVAQNYEASFARCKVPPIAEGNEEEIVESFETSFAKCSVSSATVYKEQADEHEEVVAEDYETQTVYNKEKADEIHENVVDESYKTQTVERNELVTVKSKDAPVATVTPQHDNFTPNMPPPVPKRTLLPAKTTKETNLAPETLQESSATEETDAQNVAYRDIELVSPEEVTQKTEAGERWSDSTSVSLPGQVEDVETVSSDPGNAQCEPVSEMYYTASSEVSLLSDTDLADKVQNEEDEQTKDDRKNVIAGHVAAMRERFESMTRTNTPCPDLARSLSPSLEVFRNLSPSPDHLA